MPASARSALPEVCPACGKPHRGDPAAKALALAAWRRARELGSLPAEAVAHAPAHLTVTRFEGGKAHAYGGRTWSGPLPAFALELQEHARQLVPKGEGAYFVEALLHGGDQGRAWRRDSAQRSDVIAWTARTLDADGVPGGDWTALVAAASVAGLGVLFQRSSSHTPELPAWHATIPLARPVTTDLEEWQRQDAWLVGFFSALAGLRGVGKHLATAAEVERGEAAGVGKRNAACGLDLRSKSGNRGTPVFPAARRSPEAEPPETFATPGGALDLEAFLLVTGYPEAREAWLAAAGPKRAARKRSTAPAGASGAMLARLPHRVRELVRTFAAAHGPAYAGCPDRNGAALAIGGALGRRGVAPGVAADLVEELAAAGGLQDAPARGRVARDSCQNALDGRATRGLTGLAKIVGPGPGLVRDLRDLVNELAPDTEPEREPFRVLAGSDAPRVGSADAQAFHRRVLSTPGAVGLDRRPPGTGKNHDLAEWLVDEYGTPGAEPPTPVLIACDSHRSAEAFAATLRRHAERRGRSLPLAVVPRLQRNAEDAEGFVCAAGAAEEYHRAAGLGFNPVMAVCMRCEFWPATAAGNGREPCGFHGQRADSWRQLIVFAQKTSLTMLGFWAGRGAVFGRIVADEDASTALARKHEVTQADLFAFERAAVAGERWARAQVRRSSDAGDRIRLEELVAAYCAAQALSRALREAIAGADAEAGPVAVPLALEAGACDALEGCNAGALEAGLWRAGAHTGQRPKNLLPLLAGLAAAPSAVGLVALKGGVRQLVVDVATRPPAGVPFLALDATGDQELLARDLGRRVEVLAGGTGRTAHVVQLTDSLRSRTRFKLREAEPDARELREAARVVAEIARRQRAERVGLVTYKDLTEPLTAALRAARPELLAVECMHFGACRGSNAFQAAQVDLVVVVGTPDVPPAEVARYRLRIGPADPAELVEARDWVPMPGGEVFTYPSEGMRRAHLSLVSAELVQAVGRGVRGDWEPLGGVWLLSGMSLGPFLADPIKLATVESLALDAAGSRRWDRVTTESERYDPCSDWCAKRILAAQRSGVFLSSPVVLCPPMSRQNCKSFPGQSVTGSGEFSKNKNGLRKLSGPGDGLPGSGLTILGGHATTQVDTLSLEQVREALGISARELARRLERHPQVVHRWLTGERPTPPEVLAAAEQLLVAAEDAAEREAIQAEQESCA